jgi:hypothetical protein
MNLRAATARPALRGSGCTYEAGQQPVFYVNFEGPRPCAPTPISSTSGTEVDKHADSRSDTRSTASSITTGLRIASRVDRRVHSNMIKGLMERHYLDVTRYTSSTFLRLKLGEKRWQKAAWPRICTRPQMTHNPIWGRFRSRHRSEVHADDQFDHPAVGSRGQAAPDSSIQVEFLELRIDHAVEYLA